MVARPVILWAGFWFAWGAAMEFECVEGFEKSRLKSLLDHLGEIEDPRDPWRVMHPLREVLFLVVCGTICDCEDYEVIADWGEERIDFLRRYLPYEHGVPCGRWPTILMNRIEPALFAAAFTAWVREAWPDKADFAAIDGKTLRHSHDHTGGKHALHLVSAYATTGRLVLGQEAVPDKANEISAMPALIERLGANGGMSGAVISIDAIATNATIAQTILDQRADYLLAVKANQPTLRAEIEAYFKDAPQTVLETLVDYDKGPNLAKSAAMDGLRSGWCASPTIRGGSQVIDGSRANCGCQAPNASSALTPKPGCKAKPEARRGTSFHQPPLTQKPQPPPSAAIGWSRTVFTGCSMLYSTKTSRGSGRDMGPTIWR